MTKVAGSNSACDYCGLPVIGSDGPSDEPEFCCFGCRFASAIMRERDDDTTARWTLTRLGLSIFFSMNVMVFTMAMWSQDIYGEEVGRLSKSFHDLFRYLCLLLALPVISMLGIPLFGHAWQNLRRGRLSSELLIAIGVTAAFVFSAISVARGTGQIYFEVACMVLVLVTLGRWLEATGRLKATAALEKLENLLPRAARKVRSHIERIVPTNSLVPGDYIRVRAGERIPVDCRIQNGCTHVDEQLFTGESLPVARGTGDDLIGGTVNIEGDIVGEVTAGPHEGSFGRMLEVLRAARSIPGQYQRLADRVAQWFVPAVALFAAIVFLAYAEKGILPAVMCALSVVLIACPCALGLATPLAVWSALSHAARHQVLFRNGAALERLAEVKAVRFDKTGTLSDGSPSLTGYTIESPADEDRVLSVAWQLTESSTHVFSQSIAKALEHKGIREDGVVQLKDIQTIPGQGVEATLLDDDGRPASVRLGSDKFIDVNETLCSDDIRQSLETARHNGVAIVLLAWRGRVRSLFLMEESLRTETVSAIESCKKLGLDLAVLTGDQQRRAKRLADTLQIPVLGELSPTDKSEEIQRARLAVGPTAMVGDGINDAPAMAYSDVGIALGCGADITRDSASVCIISDDLDRIPWAIDLARSTRRVVRQNLFWAFGYNSIGMTLAAIGLLNPAIAALLMVVSSVIVIVNSLRLQAGSEVDEQFLLSRDEPSNPEDSPTELPAIVDSPKDSFAAGVAG